MSSVVIAGDTSGTVTLQAPSIAGTTTLTLPATSGTVLTTGSSGQSIPKAALPTGSVLQIVQGSTSTGVTTTSSTPVTTGLTASITPLFSTSKILILVSQNGIAVSGSIYSGYCGILLRGATQLGIFASSYLYTASSVAQGSGCANFVYLDSPATTSSTTYSTSMYQQSGGAGNVLAQTGSCLSTITLMEIAQ